LQADSEMNKVAFLICSDTIGGHEFQSIELVKSAKKYCLPTIIFNNKSQMDLFEDKSINYVLAGKPFFKSGNFVMQFLYGVLNFFKMRYLLKQYDKIIVCAGTLEAGISSGVALWGGDISLYVPTFVDRTWLWGKIGFIYNLISRSFTIFFRSIITINRFQALAFSRHKKVIILPNKINISKIDNFNPRNERKLYFIGRLGKAKRILEMIAWLDHPGNPFKELIIIGDGPERENVLALSKTLKHVNISLHGWLNRHEQENLLIPADVLVFNSQYEGDPLVIREANERGSIVISRNILGIRGCTNKENRFNNQQELLKLLTLAFSNKLRKHENQSHQKIDTLRNNAARKIFV
jgi:hypothetical protein